MSNFLNAFEEAVKTSGANVFCVGEALCGQELQVRRFGQHNPCQDVYSVSKAYTVTAVGLLVDRGLLRVEETLTDVLAEELPAGCHPIWYKTTVDMLLRHQVALPGGFLDIDCFDANDFGEDYLAYTLTYPLPEDAQPKNTYTDAAFYLLGRVVEKRAGMPLDSFLWKELFCPLGCREAAWSRCPQGHAMGGTGLYIRVEDMLRLGMLYRDGGVYGGRRILSQKWVDTVLTRGYELNRVSPESTAYGKGGMRGQMLMVCPEEGRVVAWQGCEDSYPVDFVRFASDYRDEA